MFQEKTLQCRDCGVDFAFTVGEQEFYAEKGFENLPARCPECRAAKRANRREFGGQPRQMYPATCASCSVETEVPFEPTGVKPVYCRDCFQSQREYS